MSATRQALYARLVDVLGVDHALTLMHYLPDDHPATRTDLGELRGDMRDLRSDVHEEIQGLRTELHDEIQGLRTELHDEIQGLRIELHDEIQGLRTDVHEEIRGLRTDLRTEIRALHDLFAGQTRTMVLTSFGSAVTVATLVFLGAQVV